MKQNNENKLNRYALAYDYMLYLLQFTMENEKVGLGAMCDKEFFRLVAEKMGIPVDGFTWDEFDITIEHLDEKRPVIFYKFPEPQIQPEAKYGAIVIDHTENKLSYFTFEKGRKEGWWALGFNSPNERKLLGMYDKIEPSKEKFFELISGAAQLFLNGDTTAVFKMPEDYKLLNSMPDDPDNCLSYGKETDSCATFIQMFAIPWNSTMPWGEDQKIIENIHQSLAENQALIEINNGRTRRGYRYVYSIVKTLNKPSGVQYFLLMQVLYGNAALNIKAFFSEKGFTGKREASVFEMACREGVVSMSDTSKWTYDPYDKNLHRQCLMNISEESRFDKMFPEHPLTQCRNFINLVIEQ
jgi:hypothetical protein